MNIKDIEKQMLGFEKISDYKLPEQSYVAIRIDGKNFSRVTKTLEKPFDNIFSATMAYVMEKLVADIDGCIYGYTQSDEITLILHSTRESSPYFNNRVQKISSVVASKATLYFYKIFSVIVDNYEDKVFSKDDIEYTEEEKKKLNARIEGLYQVLEEDPTFDARCFVVPEDEIWNMIYWRQKDCYRNAFNGYAQYHLGAKNCQNKSMKTLGEELLAANHYFDTDVSDRYKYGLQTVKNEAGEWVTSVAPKFKYDEIV